MQTSPRSFYESRDLYAPTKAEDLLSNLIDWRNIQDIVRLTFKALTDIVRTQGAAILNLETQLNSRVSRQELTTQLQSKADSYYVAENFTEIKDKIESCRTDLSYQLHQKISVEDVRTLLENRVTTVQLVTEVKDIHRAIDQTQQYNTELYQKLEKLADYYGTEIGNRVQYSELNEFQSQLQEKYDPVWNSAVLKQEFDYWLDQKVNQEEFNKLASKLDTKAFQKDLEGLQIELSDKINLKQFYELQQAVNQKLEKKEFDKQAAQLEQQISVVQKRSQNEFEQSNQYYIRIKDELDRVKDNFTGQLARKADENDLSLAFKQLKQKAEQERVNFQVEQMRQEFNDYMINISQQQNKQKDLFNSAMDEAANSFNCKAFELQNGVEELKQQHSQYQEELKVELNHLTSYTQSLNSSTTKEFKTNLNNMQQDIEKLYQVLSDHDENKLDRFEMHDAISRISQRLDQKVEISEVKHLQNNIQNQLEQSHSQSYDAANTKIQQLENKIFLELDRKVANADFQHQMKEKADSSFVTKQINSRPTLEDLEFLRLDIDKLSQEMNKKATSKELQQHIISTKNALDEVGKDMQLKANISDTTKSLDQKAGIDEINNALSQIHNQIDKRTTIDEFNNHIAQQSLIIDALCSENTVGRWHWKSGETRIGHAVPWEIQSINTAPDNFIWERDSTGVLVITPGLYEITFGFYSNRKPNVQLLVNGESVLSAVNNYAYVIDHDKVQQEQYSGGITGLTLIDFITLPQRARVSISFSGEPAEGFLGLRKLQ